MKLSSPQVNLSSSPHIDFSAAKKFPSLSRSFPKKRAKSVRLLSESDGRRSQMSKSLPMCWKVGWTVSEQSTWTSWLRFGRIFSMSSPNKSNRLEQVQLPLVCNMVALSGTMQGTSFCMRAWLVMRKLQFIAVRHWKRVRRRFRLQVLWHRCS